VKETNDTKYNAMAGRTARINSTRPTPASLAKSTEERFEEFFASFPRGVGIPEHLASETPLMKKIRRKLLREYDRKPFREVFQLDGLITRDGKAGDNYGSSGTPDEDGDCINCEKKLELRNTDTVRVSVPLGVTRSEAARLLRKMAQWIESRREVLDPEVWEGLGCNRTVILDSCVK
jgi:hypothetical protein